MIAIGKYQVLDTLGASAAGRTYRVRDAFQSRDLAVKVLAPSSSIAAEARTAFCARLAGCAELRHRYIAGIHDLGEVDGAIYIATPVFDGINLSQAREREWSLDQKLRFMTEAAEGLAFAHAKGIAHGNLKPGNLFAAGGHGALILDFGVGDWQSLLLNSGEKLPSLSPSYFAPEQVLGQPFDARSDVFSLGLLLYELLAGRHAFPVAASLVAREIVHSQPEPLRKVDPQLPESLEHLLSIALAKEPSERMRDAEEFAAALHAIAHQMRQTIAPPAEFPPAIEPAASETAPSQTVEAPAPAEQNDAPVVQPAPEVPPALEPAATQTVPSPGVDAPAPVPAAPAQAPIVERAPKTAPPRSAEVVKRYRNRIITIAAAALLAVVFIAVLLARQNLRASQPNARTVVKQSQPAQPPAQAAAVPAPAATEALPPVHPPAAAAATETNPKANPEVDQILRTQVRSLWEEGQYAQAMQLVDSIILANPSNAEARTWKRKIRAAQDAEAAIK